MKKYLAGGKAIGSGNCSSASDPRLASSQNQAFASLLAQREAQDAMMWKQPTASKQETNTNTQLVIVQNKPSNTVHTNNKSADIDMILKGDYE